MALIAGNVAKLERKKYFFIQQVDMGLHDVPNDVDYITYQPENDASPQAMRIDTLTSDIKSFLMSYWKVSKIYFSPAAQKAFTLLYK